MSWRGEAKSVYPDGGNQGFFESFSRMENLMKIEKSEVISKLISVKKLDEDYEKD
jgi:hypothetical protein